MQNIYNWSSDKMIILVCYFNGLVQNCSNSTANALELLQSGHLNGLVQDCSNSTANILELLQSCIKLSICKCLQWLQFAMHPVLGICICCSAPVDP